MSDAPAESNQTKPRVLIVGWDAADWQILRPLMRQGHMPTLSRMVTAGAHGNLATIQPALSPMLWTSIATGKRADKHGIHGFLEPNPDGSGVRPVSSTSRKTKALWNIAHQNGLKTHVVGWYASHPAEPIRGCVVSDRFLGGCNPSMERGVHPEGAREELGRCLVAREEIRADDLAAFIPRLAEAKPEDQRHLGALAQMLARCASVQASITRLMIDEPDWDLSMVFLDGLDHLGHWFMPFHPPHRPGVDERQFGLFREVINGGCRFFDMMLGSLLSHAGEGTTLLLVSDHGFKSDALRPAGSGWDSPVNWHRGMGVAVASGPGVKAGEDLYGGTILDVTPTALRLLGVPSAVDMDGRAWLEILERPTGRDRILSWDNAEGDAGLHEEALREDPAEAAAMIQQLVDLGYVAAPTDDATETIRQTMRDNRINLAIVQMSGKNPGSADETVSTLLDEHPGDATVLFLASRMALLKRQPEEARRLAERAEGVGSRNLTVCSLLAEAAVAEGHEEEAIALYREAIDMERSGTANPGTFNRLGDALIRVGRPQAAELIYREGLGLDPDYAPLWVGLAKLARANGDSESAIEHATHAVSLMHVYPDAHLQLGEALAEAGRDDDAVVALGVCLRMAPRLRPCIDRLARLKRKLGHPDAARYETKAAGMRRQSVSSAPPGSDWSGGHAR